MEGDNNNNKDNKRNFFIFVFLLLVFLLKNKNELPIIGSLYFKSTAKHTNDYFANGFDS